jgi:hypothetical protein
MNAKKYSVMLTEYEYELLTENPMISMLCEKQLKPKKKKGDEIELSMTLRGLEELTGHVAAESNHIRSKTKAEDLGEICDYFESLIFDIKRGDKK